MKVIWFIVGMLVLATILLPLLPAGGDRTEASRQDDVSNEQPAAATNTDVDEYASAAGDAASDERDTPSADDRAEMEQALAAATGSFASDTQPTGDESVTPDETAEVTEDVDKPKKLNAAEIDRSDPNVIPEGIPGVNAPLPTSPEDFPPGYDPLIHTPEFMADLERMQEMASESRGGAEGGQLAGKGTAEDPYRITWDLLLRASQTYRPREDMRDLPDMIEQLNGKHVRISGYMLVPLGAVEFDEALLLMNMWDGCCIGLPPTAYDAVEVMLGESKKYETTRVLSFGTVEGVLKVDPYEVSNWLVGLYIIENAKVTEMM